MSKEIHIIGIAGSLRRDSYNRAALLAAADLVPAGTTLDTFELDGIPGFNQDEEQDPPAKVVELKKRIREADAVLFVTPEYNYSVPGVLKNTIDWASRPYGDKRMGRKTGCDYGSFHRNDRHGAGAISLASDVRLPQHVPRQPARSADRECRRAV